MAKVFMFIFTFFGIFYNSDRINEQLAYKFYKYNPEMNIKTILNNRKRDNGNAKNGVLSNGAEGKNKIEIESGDASSRNILKKNNMLLKDDKENNPNNPNNPIHPKTNVLKELNILPKIFAKSIFPIDINNNNNNTSSFKMDSAFANIVSHIGKLISRDKHNNNSTGNPHNPNHNNTNNTKRRRSSANNYSLKSNIVNKAFKYTRNQNNNFTNQRLSEKEYKDLVKDVKFIAKTYKTKHKHLHNERTDEEALDIFNNKTQQINMHSINHNNHSNNNNNDNNFIPSSLDNSSMLNNNYNNNNMHSNFTSNNNSLNIHNPNNNNKDNKELLKQEKSVIQEEYMCNINNNTNSHAIAKIAPNTVKNSTRKNILLNSTNPNNPQIYKINPNYNKVDNNNLHNKAKVLVSTVNSTNKSKIEMNFNGTKKRRSFQTHNAIKILDIELHKEEKANLSYSEWTRVSDKLSFMDKIKKWFLCKKKISPKLKSKLEFYEKSSKRINEKLDIIYLLSKIDEFEKFKVLFLNPFQLLSMQYMKKPNILHVNFNNVVDFYEKFTNNKDDSKNIQKILDYFQEKIDDDNLDSVDFKILELLDPEIKRTILINAN